MKSFGILICVLGAITMLHSFSQSQSISENNCSRVNTTFMDGEDLTYKIYYNWKMVWIPAGEVRLRVFEDELDYRFQARGKTYSSYDNFFKVNDYYSATVDKKTLRPKTFVRQIEEGDYRKFDSLSFDQNQLQVHSFNGKTKSTSRQRNFVIDPCILDLLSVMYSMRNTDVDQYAPGDYLDISMFLDEETFPIHMIYDRKEVKSVKNLGKFASIKVIPELIVGNVFKDGDVMNIWVSDDKNKIPMLIESPISVGSIKAVLKSYSGLKHDSILDEVNERK